MEDKFHQPVLLREVIQFLDIKEDCWYLDCTLGDGGHSLEIIKRGGKVFGLDQDPQSLERVETRFSKEGITSDRYLLGLGNFAKIEDVLREKDWDLRFEGAVFDLGVSTLQLSSPERGFSFMKEGPLDMRMDPNLAVRAEDLLNGLNKGELYELFKNYGEERYAKRIAEAVVVARPIKNTTELAKIVEDAVGGRFEKIHPATRIFQALRIAVNDELRVIDPGLQAALGRLNSNARVTVITFHSLEDGIVKRVFKGWEQEKKGTNLTDKPILPSDEEIKNNIKSRSAKLRVFQKY